MAFTLHVRVVEATDIPKMDANATDAYCILSTSSGTQKTHVIQNSMNPRWNQEFHFTTTVPNQGSLRILMKDKDTFKDDDMSNIEILYSSLPLGQVIDQWYDMVPCKKVKKGGRLHLVLHMAPAGAPPFVGGPAYPQQGYPPQGYPPQGYPPSQGYPPQGYPPSQGYPPQGYPPQQVPVADPRIQQLEAGNAALNNEVSMLRNQTQTLQAEIDRLKSKNEKMKNQLRDVQNFVTSTRKNMDKLNLNID